MTCASGVSMMIHGFGLHLPNMGISSLSSCFHGIFNGAQHCYAAAEETGHPIAVTAATGFVGLHAVLMANRAVYRVAVRPVSDSVGMRIHELKTGSWVSRETKAKAARLVFMNRTADAILNPVSAVVRQQQRPLYTAFPDRTGQTYYMYIHANAPPCEVRPVKVVGSTVEWEIVRDNLGSKPTNEVRRCVVAGEEKMIPATAPLCRQ